MNEIDALIALATKNRDMLIDAIPKFGDDPEYVTALLRSLKNTMLAITSAMIVKERHEMSTSLGIAGAVEKALVKELISQFTDFVENQKGIIDEMAARLAKKEEGAS